MTTILSADGLIEIPEVFRAADSLKPGQHCEIARLGLGEYHVQITDEQPAPRESWVKILRECPVKDWWEPLDHATCRSLGMAPDHPRPDDRETTSSRTRPAERSM